MAEHAAKAIGNATAKPVRTNFLIILESLMQAWEKSHAQLFQINPSIVPISLRLWGLSLRRILKQFSKQYPFQKLSGCPNKGMHKISQEA